MFSKGQKNVFSTRFLAKALVLLTAIILLQLITLCVHTSPTMKAPGTISGKYTASSINEKGQVIGQSTYMDAFLYNTFIWEDNTPAAKIAVSGYIKPDLDSNNKSVNAGFKVKVSNTDYSAITDTQGFFKIEGLPAIDGFYDIEISKSGYLKRSVNNIPGSKDVQLGVLTKPIDIWAGDLQINGVSDNAINIGDILQIANCFNTDIGNHEFNQVCDFNMDNAVNISDFMSVVKHFNSSTSDYPAYLKDGDKDDVAEFIEIAKGDDKLKNLNFGKCYNITTEDVIRNADCKIFKFSDSCESYLLYENQIYHLGLGFGGFGIVDIKSCDFDKNGKPELLYTYSWGSGLHHTLIGYFDLETKKETTIDQNILQLNPSSFNNDMLLEKVAQDNFILYLAKVGVDDGDFTKLILERGQYLAHIIFDNGEVKLVKKTN